MTLMKNRGARSQKRQERTRPLKGSCCLPDTKERRNERIDSEKETPEGEAHTSFEIDLRHVKILRMKDYLLTPVSLDDLSKGVKHADAAIARALFNLGKLEHCSVCGGLYPEITMLFANKRYLFTCYRVETLKRGKMLMQTDYKRMSEYLRGYSQSSAGQSAAPSARDSITET